MSASGLIYHVAYLREFDYHALSEDGMTEFQHLGVEFMIQAQADQPLQTPLVNIWLRQWLLADSAVTALIGSRIYRRRVPRTGSYPCLVYQYVSLIRDTRTFDSRRILHALRYDVKAIVQDTDVIPAQTIMQAVTQRLDRAALIAVA